MNKENIPDLIKKLENELENYFQKTKPNEKIEVNFYIGGCGPYNSIDEVEYFDNKFDEFNIEFAISFLLNNNFLFANSRKYLEQNSEICDETLVLFLNCNDVFAWGCADAESVKYSEVKDLYNLCIKYGEAGSIVWVCKKRNEKPQKPVADFLRKKELFDLIKDLPENQYDNFIKKKEEK